MSKAISCWHPGGRSANASRSAALRSAHEHLLLGHLGLIVRDGQRHSAHTRQPPASAPRAGPG